jgi:hypothetical protein
MYASKMLALATVFLATAFAQTEWKEFLFPEGNFRVLFPDNPEQQVDAERSRHQFSVTTGTASYGLEYLDQTPETDWENTVDRERDAIVGRFAGAVIKEERTSVEGYPGKWIRFVGEKTSGELIIYVVRQRLYVLHALVPNSAPRPEGFSTFLNSFRLLTKPK